MNDGGKAKDIGGRKVLVNSRHPLIQNVNTIGELKGEQVQLKNAIGNADEAAKAVLGKIKDVDAKRQIDKMSA